METQQLRPLTNVEPGETVTLARVDAGHGLNSRLAAMGLLPNVKLTVISNPNHGPFVVSVKDSRMMLGRGMAQKIMVL